jgi:hypothetical protein
MKRPSTARIVLAGIVVAGAGLDVAGPASFAGAPNHKTFSTSVSNGTQASTTSLPIPTGDLPPLRFTVTNTSSGPQGGPYGSFQLQVPTGINVTSAALADGSPGNFNAPAVNTATSPATITMTSNGPTGTGIAPSSSLTVLVYGTASNAVCPGTWTIKVKQSNDFSGSGNDFAGNNVSTPVSGGAELTWSTRPSDTEFDLNMSGPPAVTLLDACGNAVSSFSGNVTVTDTAGKLKNSPQTSTASGGTATFPSVQFTDYGITDSLVATSTDAGLPTCASTDPCTSNEFSIYQFRQECKTTNVTCTSGTLSGPLNQTLASIVADPASTPDVLTVNVKGIATGTCNSTTSEPPLGEVVDLNVDNRGKTVTLTLPKTYVNLVPNNGTPFMDICLDVTPDGAAFFDTRHYANPTAFPDQVQIGLIADCSATGGVRPCVSTRKKNAGNEIIVANLPAGDPHLIWH